MSRGGFGRGGSAPRGRGGFSSSNRGGSYGGYAPQGPPDTVLAMGQFMHSCEGEMVCKSINIKIPYFNAPIYLENKKQIGKVDEILGPLNEVYFTVKLDHGVLATSFEKNDKVYIGGDKLLPVERFLPKPASSIKAGKPVGRQGMVEKRGGGRGGFSSRGSFGGSSRGSFAPRGQSSRGSFAPRGHSGRGSFAPRARGRGGY